MNRGDENQEHEPTAPIPAVPRPSVAVATIATVMLAAAVAQGFGRFTFGVVLPDVRDELLGGSNSLAGFLATLNTFAYLVGALLVGSLSARVGPVGSMRAGLVLSVAGLATAVVAPNAAVLGIALLAMGLGGAAIWIPSPGFATAVVPEHRRGLAVGLSGAGVGLGIVFSGQLNTAVNGPSGDWRNVYRVHTVIGLVAIVIVVALLRHRGGSQPRGGFGGFSVLARIEGWKPITGCYFVYGFGYLLILAFLVARLEEDSGFSETSASRIFALIGACTIFGGVSLGRISDALGRRRTLIISYPLWAVGVLLMFTGNMTMVVIGSILLGLLFGGIPSVIAAYLIDRTDAQSYGPAYAAATFVFGIAQVASPQAGGLLADWQGNFGGVFLLSAATMTLGAVFAAGLPRGT